MQLITNRIYTGKAGRFEDFIQKFKDEHQIKTASVKVAEEQEEADSSGQLDVEPLHQTGESTTMPKNGPSAKKDDGEKAATADTDPEKEGEDSGQPKAEGSEKFINDPKVPSKEEKGGSVDVETKVAETDCTCGADCKDECTCGCKTCSASKETKVKEAALEDLPQAVQDKIKGKSSDDSDGEEKDDKDEKEEKEAATECDKCKCSPCECKDASAATQFVKWANLDSKNKSFLITYWKQLFGDEYVDALVADK